MSRERRATWVAAAFLAVLGVTTLLYAKGVADKAQIHIYWGKSTWVGWSCSKGTVKVVLDNKQIAEIREKDCVKIAVDPGEHTLQGIKQALVKRRDLTFDADAGKNVFIRGDCRQDTRVWEWLLQTKGQAEGWSASCKDVQ